MATAAPPAFPAPATSLRSPSRPQGLEDERQWVSRGQSLLIFLVFAIAFGVIGYQSTISHHVVVFDALDRLTRAFMVWHNDPQKLAAIGFIFPPLAKILMLPLAIVKPLATSVIALPVFTAICGGLLMTTLNQLLARCDMPMLFRFALLIAFAADPLILFYAGNGMSEMLYLFLLSVGLYGFVSWWTTREARFLIAAGSAFALASLTRYSFLIWAAVMAVMIAIGLVSARRTRNEVEGSTLAYLAPIVYAITLWTLFNAVIQSDAFGWLTDSSNTIAVNAASGGKGSGDTIDILGRLLNLVVGVSPLAIAVLVCLVIFFIAQRDNMALWLAGFVALGIVIIGLHAIFSGNENLLTLRDSTPIIIAALVGAAWLYREAEGLRIFIWVGTLVLLLAALPLSWHRMKHYPFQNEEQAFTRQLFSGDDQEGTSSIGGFNVGVRPERQMADYIKRHVKGKNAVLTDNAQTFGVILLSGRPQNFFDRVDKGDNRFNQVVRNPYGKVKYVLFASGASGDIVRRGFESRDRGGSQGIRQVFKTARYVLASVTRRRPSGTAASTARTTTSNPGTSTTSTTPAASTTTSTTPSTTSTP
jgi:hypothetical protein